MASSRNLSAGEVVPQMGFSPKQNQNGGWSASRDYYMLKDTWESSATQLRFSVGTNMGTADPSVDSLFSFMRVESRAASYEDSSTVLVTIQYTGAAFSAYGGQDGNILGLEARPTYRLDGRLRELPLSEHPKWKLIEDESQKFALTGCLEGRYIVSQTGIFAQYYIGDELRELKDSSGDNIEFAGGDAQDFAIKIRDGVNTYQAPTITWTENTQGDVGLTNAQLNALGKLTTPRGNPPKASGSRNWLFTSASQEQRGGLYNTTLEWTLSEDGGWEDLFYTDPDA